ncbi:Glucose 1-dehydrogenase peroxisomal 2,4-dienoyl-CoA reductase [Rhodotorula toruloides]
MDTLWSYVAPATTSATSPAAAQPPAPPSPLFDRAIIVTGCASGIGRAVALLLAEKGARLALTDKDADEGRRLCGEIKERFPNVDLAYATLDVTDEEAVGRLVRSYKKSFRRLDGLVNCAGINLPSPELHQVKVDLWSQTMDVNARGTFAFCKHFAAAVVADEEVTEPPKGGYAVVLKHRQQCQRDGPAE